MTRTIATPMTASDELLRMNSTCSNCGQSVFYAIVFSKWLHTRGAKTLCRTKDLEATK